jgi:glycogen operon protein
VTCHDGFTLHDLVSYRVKHNEANGENNHDGDNNNRSWNCGAEGPTGDPIVKLTRERQKRNFLATLVLSQGVPMLLGGDEIGRSQKGTNNGYCQDNEVSWFDWEHADRDLLEFTRRLIRLHKEHPVFRRRRWFQGRPIHGQGVPDLGWFKPDAEEMSEEDWQQGFGKSIGVFLNGEAIPSPGPMLTAKEDRAEIDGMNPVPKLLGDVGNLRCRVYGSDVRYRIKAAEARMHGPQRSPHLRCIGHVDLPYDGSDTR